MTHPDARGREPERRDEDDERGPLISSERDEPTRPAKKNVEKSTEGRGGETGAVRGAIPPRKRR